MTQLITWTDSDCTVLDFIHFSTINMNTQSSVTQQGKARILIVDDSPDILESLRGVLELEEVYDVETAVDAAAAKQAMHDFSPHIALLDIKLGRDNGLDLIPVIKTASPDIACIVMTAYRDAEYAVKAVQTGADDYLYKPLKPTELLRTLQRYVIQQRLEREKAAAERRFRAVFEQTFQLLFLLDSEGILLEVNQTALDFIGTSKQMVLGMQFWSSPWWASSEANRRQLQAALAEAVQGRFVRFEIEAPDARAGDAVLDFSLKPVLDEAGGIEYIIAEGRDITDRKQAEAKVARMAFHDALTGLPNRHLLQDRLQHELSAARRHRQYSALLFLDLDHFKRVNDTLGHAAGDALLRQAAERLQQSVRAHDTVARLGGDEFVVLLPRLGAAMRQTTTLAEMMAERLRAALAADYKLQGNSCRVTPSIGGTLFSNATETVDELLKQADSAMYCSKTEGRNRICFHEIGGQNKA